MGRISEIESDADVASRKTGTGTSTGTSKRSKANKATAKKGKADSTGDRQSTPGKGAGKDVNTVVDPNYEPPTDPFVNFSLVTLAGIQLALQTEHLSPFFNSLPLTRWSRWVGVLGVVLVAALLPSPNSLRILLTFAALSCDLSVIYGRKIGSAFGLRLGPEWGPAAASAAMSAGALLAVTRLAVVS
jgi:hypothetical protein